MIAIRPEDVTSRLITLFDPDDPASIRCFAVLAGDAAGQILSDDPDHPTWSVIREAGSGTTYLGGELDAPLLARIIRELRQSAHVLIGLWPDDARLAWLPPEPDYAGATLDFRQRDAAGLDAPLLRVPDGCDLQRMDRNLLARSADGDYYAALYGAPALALERGLGLCLLRDGEILSEAFAGPAALGQIEISVATHEAHRRRGYATVTCARLIAACEALGYRPYWNTASQNVASAALARKLGFGPGREYALRGWFTRR